MSGRVFRPLVRGRSLLRTANRIGAMPLEEENDPAHSDTAPPPDYNTPDEDYVTTRGSLRPASSQVTRDAFSGVDWDCSRAQKMMASNGPVSTSNPDAPSSAIDEKVADEAEGGSQKGLLKKVRKSISLTKKRRPRTASVANAASKKTSSTKQEVDNGSYAPTCTTTPEEAIPGPSSPSGKQPAQHHTEHLPLIEQTKSYDADESSFSITLSERTRRSSFSEVRAASPESVQSMDSNEEGLLSFKGLRQTLIRTFRPLAKSNREDITSDSASTMALMEERM